MSKLIVRPWRDLDELFEVRELLYPRQDIVEDERDAKQRLGVNIIDIWRRRGRLPHSVSSTATLTDAILTHNSYATARSSPSSSSGFLFSGGGWTRTMRSIYALAFARFVTGFCDTAQNAAVKRSMYDVAAEVGMPERWVEIRHDVTHGQIPELRVLESCVREGLVWLWERFWVRLDAGGEWPPKEEEEEEEAAAAMATAMVGGVDVREQVEEMLREFLRWRRDGIKSGQVEDVDEHVRKLISSSGRDRNLQVVADAIIESNMLLQNRKQAEVNMKAAFLIWETFLQRLVEERPGFFRSISISLVTGLTRPSQLDPKSDQVKEAYFQWLSRLFLSKKWSPLRKQSPNLDEILSEAIESCLLCPMEWTHQLTKLLLEHGDESLRNNWGPLYNASLFDTELMANDDNNGPSIEQEQIEEADMLDDPIDSENLGEEDFEKHGKRGWSLWEGGWVTRPIGI